MIVEYPIDMDIQSYIIKALEAMEKDDFALLKVIASNVETIKEEIKEIRESLKSKVEVDDFKTVKQDVEDLKKSKWFMMGVSGAVSFLITHFFK